MGEIATSTLLTMHQLKIKVIIIILSKEHVVDAVTVQLTEDIRKSGSMSMSRTGCH